MARIDDSTVVHGGAPSSVPADPQVAALQERIRNLELALESQRTIGVAIGLLARAHGCSREDAWSLLSKASQDTNIKARESARLLIAAHEGRVEDCESDTVRRLVARLRGPASAVRCPSGGSGPLGKTAGTGAH